MKRKAPPLEYILAVYDAFLRSASDTEAARSLGQASSTALNKKVEKHPELKAAKEAALQKKKESPQTYQEYLYKHLSPEARKIWKELDFWKGHESESEKINQILIGKAKKLRQEIFIHALIHTNYHMSEALYRAGVSYATFTSWVEADPEFRFLVKEIHWHKKNFFEGALIDLVAMRVPSVVIHVNKTVNADRGYGDRVQVDTGPQDNAHKEPSLDDLNLPVEVKVQVLEALRKHKALMQLPESTDDGDKPIDV